VVLIINPKESLKVNRVGGIDRSFNIGEFVGCNDIPHCDLKKARNLP
jgi:hypothetical protein